MELYQRIEKLIGKKLDEFATEQELVLLLLERVSEAQRMATMQASRQRPDRLVLPPCECISQVMHAQLVTVCWACSTVQEMSMVTLPVACTYAALIGLQV